MAVNADCPVMAFFLNKPRASFTTFPFRLKDDPFQEFVKGEASMASKISLKEPYKDDLFQRFCTCIFDQFQIPFSISVSE